MRHEVQSLECDVCKQPAIGVASSAFGAISFAYCKRCAEEGAEPYGMVVATCASCGGYEMLNDYAKQVADITLAILGKTMKQFVADVGMAIKDLNNYY